MYRALVTRTRAAYGIITYDGITVICVLFDEREREAIDVNRSKQVDAVLERSVSKRTHQRVETLSGKEK